jgi:(hydroxyamino)benzene mutase
MASTEQARIAHRLLQLGILLFLLGLLVGLAVPAFTNPRMGLAAHLEGVMNGLFLVALGLVWPKVTLSARLQSVTFWLAVYGTFANIAANVLAAIWGAGEMLPIAGQGRVGGPGQEAVIRAMLVSLALADVAVCVLVLTGLRARSESA